MTFHSSLPRFSTHSSAAPTVPHTFPRHASTTHRAEIHTPIRQKRSVANDAQYSQMNYERDFDLLGDAESDEEEEEEEEEEMIIPPQIEKFIQEERNAWVQTLMEQDQKAQAVRKSYEEKVAVLIDNWKTREEDFDEVTRRLKKIKRIMAESRTGNEWDTSRFQQIYNEIENMTAA